jgi:hypothetical protein
MLMESQQEDQEDSKDAMGNQPTEHLPLEYLEGPEQHTHSLSLSIEHVISQDGMGIVIPKSTSGESDISRFSPSWEDENVKYAWCASILYPHASFAFSEEEDEADDDDDDDEHDTVIEDGRSRTDSCLSFKATIGSDSVKDNISITNESITGELHCDNEGLIDSFGGMGSSSFGKVVDDGMNSWDPLHSVLNLLQQPETCSTTVPQEAPEQAPEEQEDEIDDSEMLSTHNPNKNLYEDDPKLLVDTMMLWEGDDTEQIEEQDEEAIQTLHLVSTQIQALEQVVGTLKRFVPPDLWMPREPIDEEEENEEDDESSLMMRAMNVDELPISSMDKEISCFNHEGDDEEDEPDEDDEVDGYISSSHDSMQSGSSSISDNYEEDDGFWKSRSYEEDATNNMVYGIAFNLSMDDQEINSDEHNRSSNCPTMPNKSMEKEDSWLDGFGQEEEHKEINERIEWQELSKQNGNSDEDGDDVTALLLDMIPDVCAVAISDVKDLFRRGSHRGKHLMNHFVLILDDYTCIAMDGLRRIYRAAAGIGSWDDQITLTLSRGELIVFQVVSTSILILSIALLLMD